MSWIPDLEARTLRAWPASEEESLGGWIARSAGGYTRRANSVYPIGPPGGEVGPAIDRAQAWFRARGQQAIFKLTPEAAPAGLDAELEARGWAHEAPTRVMVRLPDAVESRESGPREAGPLAVEPRPDPATEVPPRPGPEWLDCFETWNSIPAECVGLHRGILGRIAQPGAFGLHREEGGEPVACGLAVADPPWVGLYDLVTEPGRRGRGHGTALVDALLAWGNRQGCDHAYLQVTDENRSARSLYERLGFGDAYPYWYRIAP